MRSIKGRDIRDRGRGFARFLIRDRKSTSNVRPGFPVAFHRRHFALVPAAFSPEISPRQDLQRLRPHL
jgi:hypothetical protein